MQGPMLVNISPQCPGWVGVNTLWKCPRTFSSSKFRRQRSRWPLYTIGEEMLAQAPLTHAQQQKPKAGYKGRSLESKSKGKEKKARHKISDQLAYGLSSCLKLTPLINLFFLTTSLPTEDQTLYCSFHLNGCPSILSGSSEMPPVRHAQSIPLKQYFPLPHLTRPFILSPSPPSWYHALVTIVVLSPLNTAWMCSWLLSLYLLWVKFHEKWGHSWVWELQLQSCSNVWLCFLNKWRTLEDPTPSSETWRLH